VKSLYQLVYGWLLRFSAKKDHFNAALAHLLYGLHNRLLRLCPQDTAFKARLHGFEFLLPAGHLLPVYLCENPDQEKPLLDLVSTMQRFGRPGDFVMVDVGANIGDTAIPAALRAPQGTFLCIEGSPGYFHFLERNVERAEMAGRFLLREVLCGESGDQGLMIEANFGSGVVKRGDGGEGTPLATLDHILEQAGLLDRVSLIKVDTDGFDYKVLRGGRKCLETRRPVLFFELAPTVLKDQKEDPLGIFPVLQEWGYSDFLLYTNFGEFFGHGRFDDPAGMEFLHQAIQYALRHRRFFYDVVVLTGDHRDLRTDLMAAAADAETKNE
jgi:FkbM family methyltransferase